LKFTSSSSTNDYCIEVAEGEVSLKQAESGDAQKKKGL
jgi:hypothetical protein